MADVDGDGVPEIVTGGFTYDGTKVEGQLRIWNWSGGVLNLEKSQEWANLDITEPTSMSINDVDGDGKKEIVTSGYTTGYGSFAVNAEDKSRAELKVWSWDGNTLTLKQSKDWIVGEAVSAWNVGTGDVDNDGVVEIVTVGCMQTINLRDCDPDLRIWSITSVPSASFPYLVVAIVGVTVADGWCDRGGVFVREKKTTKVLVYGLVCAVFAHYAVKEIKRRKLRSLANILGYVIAVAFLIIIVTLRRLITQWRLVL